MHDLLSASRCSPLSFIFYSITVKPVLEKYLLEEADGAEMQRLLQFSLGNLFGEQKHKIIIILCFSSNLQLGKLNICGPPFLVSNLKG